jgi:sialidase-1
MAENGAEILGVKVLCREPGRYIGWPSITQAPNGDLLAVFSGDRSAHVSPDGKVQMVRSRDGGATWEGPTTVFDSPIDDRDSGIIVTAKGTVLVSTFTNPGGEPWQGHWVLRSTDNGRTWGQPIRTEVTTPHGPIQLRDGRLLYVGQRPHESHKKPYDVGIQESLDDGLTWRTVGAFPVPAGDRILSYDECHPAECADGTVVLQFRDCYEPHLIRQSESRDGGRTWTAPHVTPIKGYPPHVIRLRDGRLLTVYGKRWAPFGEYACLSADNGVTWDVGREIALAPAPDGDLGYPASVEARDGTIWTVFYQKEKAGDQPCLMGTHWKPPRR